MDGSPRANIHHGPEQDRSNAEAGDTDAVDPPLTAKLKSVRLKTTVEEPRQETCVHLTQESRYGKLVFAIFAALAQFERELIRERTLAGLASARARGRKGGRPHALSKAQVRLAQAAMAQRDTKVSELCLELGVTKATI